VPVARSKKPKHSVFSIKKYCVAHTFRKLSPTGRTQNASHGNLKQLTGTKQNLTAALKSFLYAIQGCARWAEHPMLLAVLAHLIAILPKQQHYMPL
jgi:hypothetical protein